MATDNTLLSRYYVHTGSDYVAHSCLIQRASDMLRTAGCMFLFSDLAKILSLLKDFVVPATLLLIIYCEHTDPIPTDTLQWNYNLCPDFKSTTAFYIFANMAAAPPAAINAAVGTAANGPAPPATAVVAIVAAVKVVVGKAADVKGASCTGIAPVKAGACDAAETSGTASAALGLSTL